MLDICKSFISLLPICQQQSLLKNIYTVSANFNKTRYYVLKSLQSEAKKIFVKLVYFRLLACDNNQV